MSAAARRTHLTQSRSLFSCARVRHRPVDCCSENSVASDWRVGPCRRRGHCAGHRVARAACARRRRNGQLLKILQKGGTSMEQLQLQNQTLSKSCQILHKLTGSGSLNPAHQFPILAACGAKQPGEVSRKDACSLALSPFEGCID